MKYIRIISILVVSLFLASCATTTPNFAVKDDFWKTKNKVVGIAFVELPQPSAHKGGNQGLLDMAINNANAGELETYLNSLDTSKVNTLKEKMSNYLSKRGFKVKTIDTPIKLDSLKEFERPANAGSNINYAQHDFKHLRGKYGVDKLVLISIKRIGTIRSYYGFIPTGAPSGLSHLNGQVINLGNNILEWNQSTTQTAPNTSVDWDTPPNYPGLTSAMYTAFDQSIDAIYNQFVQ